MIDFLYQSARRLRRLPGLRNATWIWRTVHGPVYGFLRGGRWGVRQALTHDLTIRIPAYFLRKDWENYEVEAVGALIDWCRQPRARAKVFLDVGSSIGFFSSIALFADPEVAVYAFDSDLESLRLARQFCRYAKGSRLNCIYGFVADSARTNETLQDAIQSTDTASAKVTTPPSLDVSGYRMIGEVSTESIPARSLDQLTDSGGRFAEATVLIKVDVEGFELTVLRGALGLLRANRPSLLLSVHPEFLQKLGQSTSEVGELLKSVGYTWKVLAVDHEEHWWCTPL